MVVCFHNVTLQKLAFIATNDKSQFYFLLYLNPNLHFYSPLKVAFFIKIQKKKRPTVIKLQLGVWYKVS
jgi:hypothetical protein